MTKVIGVGTFETTDLMRKNVSKVLETGRLSYGPMSREFENKFAKMRKVRYAILSNSGTSSLHVALQALKEVHEWDDGDEVIVPASTFVATSNIILHNNLTPVFVDVDPITYNINPLEIEKKVNDKTRAIIPVHLYGQPADMTSVVSIARKHDLKIIEDSCECVTARHRGDMVGSMGDIGCFSTYVAHLITTGVGGFSVTDNPVYAAKMRSIVNHGRDGIYISIDDDTGVTDEKKKEIISRRFKFETVGHSFRVTELESAIGLAQLPDLARQIKARNVNANALSNSLFEKGLTSVLQTPAIGSGNEHDFMMYPILLYHEPKWDLCNYLEKRGIETREMMPLINQPVYAGLVDEDDYPIAKWINRSGFYVGCHQTLTEEDMLYIADTIGSYFEGK